MSTKTFQNARKTDTIARKFPFNTVLEVNFYLQNLPFIGSAPLARCKFPPPPRPLPLPNNIVKRLSSDQNLYKWVAPYGFLWSNDSNINHSNNKKLFWPYPIYSPWAPTLATALLPSMTFCSICSIEKKELVSLT